MIRSILATTLGILASVPITAAQDEDKEPALTASLIPVGSGSDAYWEGDGPGMRAVALDPEAAPPKTLSVRTRDGLATIPASLNRPSPALPVREGSLRVFANTEASDDGEPPLFGEYAIAAGSGHFDIFVNRDPEEEGWDDAQSLTLPASTDRFPMGAVRLINLSGQTVKARLGTEMITVPSREVRIHRPGAEADDKLMTVQAAHARRGGDGARVFLRTGIKGDSSGRTNLIFYPGRDPEEPVKATWYRQIPPAPIGPSEEDAS